MTELTQLNFPANYQIRMKKDQETTYIFCRIRKSWMVYTPEEWVRQHIIFYLIDTLGYSQSSIALEVPVKQTGMRKRADIVVYKKGKPYIMVECKRPSVQITQQTFDQIARYNGIIGSDLLMVSNGLSHYYCVMDYENRRYQFLKELPKNIKATS